MHITRCNIVPVSTTACIVDIVISDPSALAETTELLRIRTRIETLAYPLLSAVRKAALQNARALIVEQIRALDTLPPHPEHE